MHHFEQRIPNRTSAFGSVPIQMLYPWHKNQLVYTAFDSLTYEGLIRVIEEFSVCGYDC
jgi:hypothetical protein